MWLSFISQQAWQGYLLFDSKNKTAILMQFYYVKLNLNKILNIKRKARK
jgi:hypothetical protein